MCVVCGCSGEHAGTPRTAAKAATAAPGAPNGDLDFGANAARVSVPGLSTERAIKLEADVLGENDRVAARNRAHFTAHGVTALNLVSSPGSGKTTLLCATITALRRRAPGVEVAVIEGDQQTSNDADRIRATGAPAIQINTGKGCHLDAPMVAAAFERLPLHRHGGHGHADAGDGDAGDGADRSHGRAADGDGRHAEQAHAHIRADVHEHTHEHTHEHGTAHGHAAAAHGAHGPDAHDHGDSPHAHAERLLFIENVGNLVCPAMWDLGEAAKVAILSVTEGEDKPLKYPDMFAAARLMVLNKTDLLPYLDFDVERCIAYARRVNPTIEVLQLSAKSGDGMDAWLSWLLHLTPEAAPSGDDALRRRIAELEAQVRALGGPR